MARQKGNLEHDATTNSVAGSALKAGIERIERINEEIKTLQEDCKEFFAELKGNGYNPKIVRKVIQRRAMEAHKRAEEDALVHIYSKAVGTPSPADAETGEDD